jgi:hypothetical protein
MAEIPAQHGHAQAGKVVRRRPGILGCQRRDQARVGAEVARLARELACQQTPGLGRQPELAGKARVAPVAERPFQCGGGQCLAQARGRHYAPDIELEGVSNDRAAQPIEGRERFQAPGRLIRHAQRDGHQPHIAQGAPHTREAPLLAQVPGGMRLAGVRDLVAAGLDRHQTLSGQCADLALDLGAPLRGRRTHDGRKIAGNLRLGGAAQGARNADQHEMAKPLRPRGGVGRFLQERGLLHPQASLHRHTRARTG